MRGLLPPRLDFITGSYGDPMLQAKPDKALLDGLLDDTLERDLASLSWEAPLTIQDDWEKPDLLQGRGKAFDVVILDLCPGCALPVGQQDGQGREKMGFPRPIFRLYPVSLPPIASRKRQNFREVILDRWGKAVVCDRLLSLMDGRFQR
jgi:hypothetical protein